MKNALFLAMTLLAVTNVFAQNYVQNGNFVKTTTDEITSLVLPAGWNLEGKAFLNDKTWILKLVTSWLPTGAIEGTHVLNLWRETNEPYQLKLTQTINGLPDGVYTLSATAAFGGENVFSLYAKIGENETTVPMPESSAYEKKEMNNIQITGGTAIVGFTANSSSSTDWFDITGFELVKTGNLPPPSINITKDLEDATICVNESHTFEVGVEGEGLAYEWYYGNRRIQDANMNRYTITHAQSSDYGKYYVIVRSNYNGYQASRYSKQVRLWVAEQLPETLRFANFPDRVEMGKTYHLKLAGYSDVTNYRWSYSKEGVTFSPETGGVGKNEVRATFGTLSEGTGTMTATLTHPCGTREVSRTIRVSYPTGREAVTAAQVAVYPNPTTEMIRISNTVSNQVVRITDITGSLKGRYSTQEGITTIDLSGYAKGTYLVHYDGKTVKVVRK
jgi:hypothetical protein